MDPRTGALTRPPAAPSTAHQGAAPSLGRQERSTGAARWAVLAALMILYAGLGGLQAWRDAPTLDEGINLAAGVSVVVRHDIRMNPEHPAAGRVWSSWPAVLADPIVPEGASWRNGNWPGFTAELLSANRRAGRLHRVLFLSRLMPLVDGLLIALVLHTLGRRLFGPDAGLVAAGLWLTTPVFIGFGHVGTTDLTFTLAVLLVCLTLERFDTKGRDLDILLVGLACGAALLTRFTGIVVAPAAAIAVALISQRRRRNAWVAALAVMFVAWASVWVGIRGLAPSATKGAVRTRYEKLIEDGAHHDLASRAVLLVPWPVEYRAGFGYLAETSGQRGSYVFGRYTKGADAFFFPASALAKLPAGALAVAILGPFAIVVLEPLRRRRALCCVGLPIAACTLAILTQPLHLGLRYLFPTVAGLFLLGSAVAEVVARRVARPAALAVGGVLLLTQLAAAVESSPHSLAWTAPPFRPGYRYVSDSNLDLGQDWFAMEAWARAHPRPWVALVGALPKPARSRNLVLARPSQVRGWVVVSSFGLNQVHRDELAWLRAYCPVGDFGGTILLYRFDQPPTARAGPAQPAAPCPSATFSHR